MQEVRLDSALRRSLRAFLSDGRGQSIIEFAVALPFLVAMAVGTFAVGIVIDRYLTLGQLVRNGGNMYARGIEFGSDQNKQFLIDAATGLDLQLAAGRTSMYLTLLTRVPQAATCNGSPCANAGMVVIAQRFSIGDFASGDPAMSSRLGMPVNLDSDGNHLDFFDDSDARATAPSALAAVATGIQDNELIYAVEAIHRPTTIAFQGIFSPDHMFSRAFF